jgi:hypothetical protein
MAPSLPLDQATLQRWIPVIEEAEAAFRALQSALAMASVLQLPSFSNGFIVECDKLGSKFGTVLHQGVRAIAFFSCLAAPRHAKLAAYERILIGLIHIIHLV